MLVLARRINVPDFASVVSVNDRGIPRYWACAWVFYLPAFEARSTLQKKLRDVDHLYNHADSNWGEGYLDQALSQFSVPVLCDILEGYFVAIQNSGDLNSSSELRWQTGLHFVLDTCRRIARDNTETDSMAELKARLRTLEFQTGHLYIGNP